MSDARQHARDGAADAIATKWEVTVDPRNSGFSKPGRRCGTYSSYVGGCRCERCRGAKREYMRSKRIGQ